MPFLRLNQSRLNREMLSGATEEQYGIIGRHRLAEMEEMDAYIEIRGGGNAFELSAVPQKSMAVAMKALNPVSQRRIRHTRWCGLRWPSEGMAQQAAMSTEKFEDFYFRTCLMDYGALRPAMQKLAAMMEAAEHVRITGPGTDISFSIKGLPAIPCARGNATCRTGRCSPHPSLTAPTAAFPSTPRACSRAFPLTTSA